MTPLILKSNTSWYFNHYKCNMVITKYSYKDLFSKACCLMICSREDTQLKFNLLLKVYHFVVLLLIQLIISGTEDLG